MSIVKILRLRASQGSPYIRDLRGARPDGFRGLPVLAKNACGTGCDACKSICPTEALALAPLRLDLGKCVFCGECAEVCPENKIHFSSDPRLASSSRDQLEIGEGGPSPLQVRASEAIRRIFGRSLKLRQVSAGGCNACELELNAIANVNFDLQRFGIEWVASPRHADALVVTGPLTRNMSEALRLAWDAVPDPRFLVLVGACAISGGLYSGAAGVDRGFLEEVTPAVYVPGCPVHPLSFVHAILDLLGVKD